MTSMTNSYTWIATSMTVGRLHFRTFQVYIQSPVTAADIVVGQILAGMVRGLFASVILLGLGLFLGTGFHLNLMFILVLVLNCLVFAAFGVIVGMKSRSHEDTATFTNFFIMPMAFFCGTFFPVEEMPWLVRDIIKIVAFDPYQPPPPFSLLESGEPGVPGPPFGLRRGLPGFGDYHHPPVQRIAAARRRRREPLPISALKSFILSPWTDFRGGIGGPPGPGGQGAVGLRACPGKARFSRRVLRGGPGETIVSCR